MTGLRLHPAFRTAFQAGPSGLMLSFALCLAPSASASDAVDLSLSREPCANLNDTIIIEIEAQANGSSPCSISGLEVILQWDPTQLELVEATPGSSTATWIAAGFLNDFDGLNDSLDDGDAIFTALSAPAAPTEIPPGRVTVIYGIRFRLIGPPTDGAIVAMVPTLGGTARTRVLASTPPIWNLTGQNADQTLLFACPIGEIYCNAVPNSTGSPGQLRGTGSPYLASNDLVLEATSLPQAAFGIFIASRFQDVGMPGGTAQGVVCLGNPIGRGVGGAIFFTGTTGSATAAVDWAAVPQPSGPEPAAIGETWNFQAWHRDANPNATSNFTTALSILVR